MRSCGYHKEADHLAAMDSDDEDEDDE